jgi:hypothetical protein
VDLPRKGISSNKNAWELFGDGVPGEYIECDGVDYMRNLIWKEGWDNLGDTLVIVSAVPGRRISDMARRLFPNTLIWYPGKEAEATGEWADALLDELDGLDM